ncbi:uncharacterized protein LOC131952494 [Physella acuta]|uniref:uncharacterized protein LOC131952494 n=1 Tax=Physella acuta TaxID=109671 RepID=UPI0027DDE651|nr:uncharacterized protein LOC131952494 [Physella acuta]
MGSYQRHPSHNPEYKRLKQVLKIIFRDKYNIRAQIFYIPYCYSAGKNVLSVYSLATSQNSDLVDDAEVLATEVTRYMIKESQSDIQCEEVDESLAYKVFGDKKLEVFTLIKIIFGETNEETQDSSQQETSHNMNDVTGSVSKCLLNKMAGYIQNDLRVRFKDGFTCRVMDYPLYKPLKHALIKLFRNKYKILGAERLMYIKLHHDSDLVDNAEGLATEITYYIIKELESDIHCEEVDEILASQVFGDEKEAIFTVIKQFVEKKYKTKEDTQDGQQQEISHNISDIILSASKCLMKKMAVCIQNLKVRVKGGFICKVVDYPFYVDLQQTLFTYRCNNLEARFLFAIFPPCKTKNGNYFDLYNSAENLATKVTCYIINTLKSEIKCEKNDESLTSEVFGKEQQQIFTIMKQFVDMKYISTEVTKDYQSATLYDINDVTTSVAQVLMNKMAGYIRNNLKMEFKDCVKCEWVQHRVYRDFKRAFVRGEFVKVFGEIMVAKELYSRQIAIFTFCFVNEEDNVPTNKPTFRITKQSTSSMCAFLCPPHVYLRGADDSDKSFKA